MHVVLIGRAARYVFRKLKDIELYVAVDIDDIYVFVQRFGYDTEKSLLLFTSCSILKYIQ